MKIKILFILSICLLFVSSVSAGPYSNYGNIAFESSTLNVPQFPGTIYYVDGTHADDTNNGLTPCTAKKTIGAALAAMSAGDTVIIKAGTYTEIGLDVTKAGVVLQCEIGVLIDPASGTALTISGDFCKIDGALKVIPAAGEIGLLVSGIECYIKHVKVSTGEIGFQITGTGCIITDCVAGNQTAIGYDIQGGQTRIVACSTIGVGATYGYKINNSANNGVLRRCTSSGHAAAGFYINTGSQDWTILNCSTGAGDGKWRDIDSANVWSGLMYPETKQKRLILDANNATKAYNLFKVIGIIKLKNLYAHVVETLSANHTNCFLDVYDGTSIPITKNTTLTMNAAPIGSLFIRDSDATNVASFSSGAGAFIDENSAYRNPFTEVIVGAKGDETATYIRFVHTTTDTPSSGVIHFHFEWIPLTDDGNLIVQ